ncbi:YadA-like family protein [Uruburuella suis]|uniref:YadA-like family protein n=1 Tax=Uruburuella suis TaxID=252130 RepID=UPI002490419E|nr:YadA-like family protein [Uruburuella suis]
MNKIYKTVWNEASQSWVAVSELDTAHGKRNVRSSTGAAGKAGFAFNLAGIAAACMMALGAFVSTPASASNLQCTTSNGTGNINDPGGNVICGPGATANTGQGVAIGGAANAAGDQAVAVGANTIAQGNSSVAIGGDDLDKVASNNPPGYQTPGNNATYNNRDAAKIYSALTGDYLVNFADPTKRYIPTKAGHGAVALGVQALAGGELSTAFGTRAAANGVASLALGVGANASKDGAVALGAGSTTATNAEGITQATVGGVTYSGFAGGGSVVAGDQVSIGSVGFESQLKNLAPGAISATSTDAVNGSQLYSVASTLQGKLTHFYSVGNADSTAGNFNNDAATGYTNALAAGVNAKVGGARATAVGNEANAVGLESVAIGNKSQAANTSGVAIGNTANAAGGSAVAIGVTTISNGAGSTAIALDAKANGDYTLALGRSAQASQTSATSLGSGSKSDGQNALAVGSLATASGNNSTALGSGTNAAMSAVAIGNQANAGMSSSVAVGFSAQGSAANTIAIGSSAIASAGNALAAGVGAQAAGAGATAVGSGAKVAGGSGVAVGAGANSAAGAGVAVGYNTVAFADNATAVGKEAKTGGSGSSAFGGGANASGGSSVAVGSRANATDSNTVALGYNANASKDGAVSIGLNSISSNTYTLAAGGSAQATGSYAIALGRTSIASGSNSIAIGNGAKSGGGENFSLGSGAGSLGFAPSSDYTGPTDFNSLTKAGYTNNAGLVNMTSIGGGAGSNTINNNLGVNIGPSAGSGYNSLYGQGVSIGNQTGQVTAFAPVLTSDATKFVSGDTNTAISSRAGQNVAGHNNIAVGIDAGGYNQGRANVAIGEEAGRRKEDGNLRTDSKDATDTDKTNFGGTVAIGQQAIVTADRAIAIGSSSGAVANRTTASAADAVAFGTGAKAVAVNAIAIGKGAQATANNAISIGIGNVVSGANSGALGDPSHISGAGSYVIGNNNGTAAAPIAADNAGAFGNSNAMSADASGSRIVGNNNNVQSANAMVMGNNVTIGAGLDGAVVLGYSSSADAAVPTNTATVNKLTYSGFAGNDPDAGDIVSVGAAGSERQIKNVAAGQISSTSTDAINGSQLYATQNVIGNVAAGTANILGGDAAVGSDGLLTMSDVGGTGKGNVHEAIEYAAQGWNVAANGNGSTKVAPGSTVDFVNGTGTTATLNSSGISPQVSYSVNTSTLTTASDGIVSAGESGDSFATAESVAEAINSAQKTTIVAAGTNIADVNRSSNGKNTTYTVNADGAKVSGSDAVTVTVGAKDATSNITDYAVDLSDKAKEDIAKGVRASNDIANEGITFTGNNGSTDAKKLGDTLAITGDSNITTTASSDGLKVELNKNLTGLTSISAGPVTINADGIDAGSKPITNVASGGTTATNAANIGDVQKAAAASKTTVTQGSNIVVRKITDPTTGADSYEVATAKEVKFDKTTVGTVVTDGTSNKISGLAAGEVSKSSTDAINGSQLFAQGEGVKNIIGGNTAYDPSTGVYTNADIGGTGKGNINDAIKAAKTEVAAGTNVAGVVKTEGSDGQNIYTVNAKGTTASAGSTAVTVSSANKGSNVTDYAIDLSQATKDSLVKADNAVQYDDAGKTSVTLGGTGSSTAVKLTNLADGNVAAGSSDAVTGNQLFAVKDDLGKATFGLSAQDGTSVTQNLNGTIGVVGGATAAASSSNVKTVVNNGKIEVQIVDAPTFAGTVTSNTGFQVAGGPSFTKTGIDAAGNKITNLAKGTDAGDAVNASQLNALGSSTASSLGGTSSYDAATNSVTAGLKVGSNTYSSVQEALNNIDGVANSGWQLTTTASGGSVSGSKTQKIHPRDTVTIDAGKNIAITQKEGTISIATSDTPEFTSISLGDAGNSTVLRSGANGLDVGGDKVTNLADGTIAAGSTDAVTGGQLHATNQNVATNTGNIATNTAAIAKGIKFGDGSTSTQFALGDTINVKGDGNLTSTTTADGVKLGLGNSISIGSTNPVRIDGNAGTIGGLTNTTFNPNSIVSGQAATEDQLKAVSDVANTGWNLQTNADTAGKVAPGDTVKFIDGDNIEITRNGNDITVATAKALTVDSITAGGNKLDSTGLTIANGPSVTAGGINAGNKPITDVASGGDTLTNAANIGDVQKAAAGAKTEVKAGTNVTSVAESKGSGGQSIYTVNADGASVSGSDAVKVTAGAKDATSNITDYAVDLSDKTKADITKGVTASEDIANKGITFTGDNSTTTDEKKLGDTLAVKGDNNITTTAGSDGLGIALNKNLVVDSISAGDSKLDTDGLTITGGPSFTKTGINAAGNKITNVAAGSVGASSTDAVNGSQLYGVADSVKTVLGGNAAVGNDGSLSMSDIGGTGENNINDAIKTVAGTAAKHNTVVAGDNIEVTSGVNAAGGIEYKVATAKDVSFDTVKVGDVKIDGATNKISGLAAGDIGAGSTDAVNGSQLFAQGEGVKNIIGGNTAYDPSTGVYTNADIGGTGKGNINDAIKAANDQANKPLTFAGDSGTPVNRKLGETVNVKGGNTGTLTEGNIGVVASADTLTVKLAEAIDLGSNGSIAMGNTKVSNDGLTIINGPSVTGGGIDAGGKAITNVASGGDTATNAANIGDVQKAAAGAKTEVKEGENIKVSSTTGADGQTIYTVATAKDVSFNTVNVGGVKIDSTTNKISGLTSGNIAAGSTEAVNGGQIKAIADANQAILGGNSKVNADGTTTMSNIGGTGKDNINDAIAAANTAATQAKSTVSAGDNIVVTPSTNADGSTHYQVAAAKDLKADSLTTGNTVVNSDGITIGNGAAGSNVSLSKDGLNNGGNTITNVADGVNATDAVNKGQLDSAIASVNTDVTNITNNVSNINQIIGGDNYVNQDGSLTPEGQLALKTYNVQGQTEYVHNSVISAIKNMNEQGIKFFHTNSGQAFTAEASNTEDSSAGGSYSTAIGYQASTTGEAANGVAIGNQSKVSAANGVAIGSKAAAGGTNAIAIGSGAQATGSNSISIGTGNVVSGNNSGAFGDPSTISGNNSYVVGNDNTVVTDNSFVIGNNVKTTAANSVNLGSESAAITARTDQTAGTTEYASTTINGKTYNFAGATPTGVVSVGDVGSERRVQNVAAGLIGEKSTDAINGSQLYATNKAVEALQTGGAGIVQYSNADSPTTPNGGTASNDVTLVGADQNAPVVIHNVGAGVHGTDAVNVNQLQTLGNQLNSRIDGIENNANAGTAAAMAVAGLPQAYLPGKSMMAVAGSTYRGEGGYAIGFSSISDGGNWVIKGTASGNSRGHYGATAGVGYQW